MSKEEAKKGKEGQPPGGCRHMPNLSLNHPKPTGSTNFMRILVWVYPGTLCQRVPGMHVRHSTSRHMIRCKDISDNGIACVVPARL